MRTLTQDRWWIFVLAVALVPMIVLVSEKPLMADKVEFSVSTELEREEVLLPGVRSVIDTYNQDFNVNWSETYSSRLSVDLSFELEMEDIIRLLDVDEKTVTPSFEISMTSMIWDLSYFIQDKIIYSNEFNTARRDEIEFSLDVSLEPFYFPPLNSSLQRLIDLQPNLEDKVENKFDISTDYSVMELLSVDLTWKQEQVDDRFIDDNDSNSRDWEIKLGTNQLLTQSLKMDVQTSLDSSREETLNNTGTLLNLEKVKTFNGRLKLTLDTFPNFTSDLELETTEEMVGDEVENSVDLSAKYSNAIVGLGDLTETIVVTKTDISEPGVKTDQLDTSFEIILEGEPGQYLGYAVGYVLDLASLNDVLDSANDSDTQSDEFDFSFTITLKDGASLDSSFNWSVERENGAQASSSKELKIEGLFKGEYLDVPNLVFRPGLSYVKEKNFIGAEISNKLSVTLGFLYTFILPPNADWGVETEYEWEDASGEVTSGMTINSSFQYNLPDFPWELQFEETSDIDFDLSGGESTIVTHEFSAGIVRELTPTIIFDADYEFEYDSDGNNSDKVESHLEWKFRTSALVFGFINDRVFEEGLDITRTYSVEFSMEF